LRRWLIHTPDNATRPAKVPLPADDERVTALVSWLREQALGLP